MITLYFSVVSSYYMVIIHLLVKTQLVTVSYRCIVSLYYSFSTLGYAHKNLLLDKQIWTFPRTANLVTVYSRYFPRNGMYVPEL